MTAITILVNDADEDIAYDVLKDALGACREIVQQELDDGNCDDEEYCRRKVSIIDSMMEGL